MPIEIAADTVICGTYRVVRTIGRGGMGEVYEARHLRTKASLALKILLADRGTSSPQILDRFRREAEIMSSLNHPNIVRVFDSDKLPDGRPFLVMELLEGRELTQLMRPRVPLPPATVAPVIEQIALGLSAAHARGIVHRDLKPSNVFLTTVPGSGRELVKLLDFGISKVGHDAAALTATNSIMGTPHYMSPEQADGKTGEATDRADQFALAAISYEMLSGHRAFPGDEPVAVLYRVVHQQPPDLRSRVSSVPRELEDVVNRGLAKRADDRFPSIEAFARAFVRSAGIAELDAPDGPSTTALTETPVAGAEVAETLRPKTPARSEALTRSGARGPRKIVAAAVLTVALIAIVAARSSGSRARAISASPAPLSRAAESTGTAEPPVAPVGPAPPIAARSKIDEAGAPAATVLHARPAKKRRADLGPSPIVESPPAAKTAQHPIRNEDL
jgi:serine/threonine protein kinase